MCIGISSSDKTYKKTFIVAANFLNLSYTIPFTMLRHNRIHMDPGHSTV